MIHPITDLLLRLFLQLLNSLHGPLTTFRPHQILQTLQEADDDIPRALRPRLEILQPVGGEDILMHLDQAKVAEYVRSPRIARLAHHQADHGRLLVAAEGLHAVEDGLTRGARGPRRRVVQREVARVDPLQPAAGLQQRHQVRERARPVIPRGHAAREADGDHIVGAQLGRGEGQEHVLRLERDVGRQGLRCRASGQGEVVANELAGRRQAFGYIEEPGSGAGTNVCDLGCR